MMKKLLSLFLSLALVGSLGLPAMAAGEDTADARLSAVTETVKEALDLDTAAYDTFSGSLVEGDLIPTWRLRWSGEDCSLTLTTTEDGRILTYNRYSNTASRPGGGTFHPSFPSLTRAEARQTALTFLSKALASGVESAVIDADPSAGQLSAESYMFSGEILLNGLPSPLHFTIQVSVADHAVSSFYTMGVNYDEIMGGVPSSAPAAASDAAGEALKDTLSLRLEYVLSEDGEDAVLRYLPNSIDTYYVDAQTGKLVNLSALYSGLERGGAAGGTDGGSPEFNASLSTKNQLTEAELAGIAQMEGVLSRDALDAAARKLTALGLAKYTLSGAVYTVDPENGDVAARLQYARQTDEGIWRRYVTLDGKTAALQAVSSSAPWSEDLKTTVSAASAQTKAEAFLAAVCGEDYAKTALYNSEDALSKDLSGIQRTFIYAQQENGFFFPANALTVAIDCTDGSVSRYSRAFDHEVTFQSPEGIIDLDAALEAWFQTYDVVLEYLAVPEKLDLSAPEYKPLIEQGYSYLYALKLSYALEREAYSSGIDAMTGEAVAENTAPEQHITYDDLENHWVRGDAEALAGYGVGWLGGSLEPGKALTQRDLVALLVSTGGWLYDSTGGEEAADALYDRAYSMGILRKDLRSDDALLTRAQTVKLLLDSAGYGDVAGLEGIFHCSFADESDIPAAFYGYAALAQGLGIVEGSGGSFHADRTATRAEAAVMLCRFLAR